jgi:hypothetical protein
MDAEPKAPIGVSDGQLLNALGVLPAPGLLQGQEHRSQGTTPACTKLGRLAATACIT